MSDHAALLLRRQLRGTVHKQRTLGPVLIMATPQRIDAASGGSPLPGFFYELSKSPVDYFSAGLVDDSNVFEWDVTIIGPSDTIFEGGFFKGVLTFPQDYPNSPPEFRFTSEIWHPNVYPDGRVCISILHSPGDDPHGYEQASERVVISRSGGPNDLHGMCDGCVVSESKVETIMISIISMLSSPNDESPANIDAAKDFREDYPSFKKKVRRCVRKSQEMT